MFWRSPQEQNKLKAETDKAILNIVWFGIFGSVILNAIIWFVLSNVKVAGYSWKELLKINFVPVAFSIGCAVIYTMLIVKDYRKSMRLFKGDPNEEVCEEAKKKAVVKIARWSLAINASPWIIWVHLVLLRLI